MGTRQTSGRNTLGSSRELTAASSRWDGVVAFSPKLFVFLLFVSLLALGLLGALSSLQLAPALAQVTNPIYVSIQTSQTQVHEGGLAAFTLKRTGGSYTNSLTVGDECVAHAFSPVPIVDVIRV